MLYRVTVSSRHVGRHVMVAASSDAWAAELAYRLVAGDHAGLPVRVVDTEFLSYEDVDVSEPYIEYVWPRHPRIASL